MINRKHTDINKWVPVGLIVDEKGNVCEGERFFRQCPECSLFYSVPYACYEPLACPLCAVRVSQCDKLASLLREVLDRSPMVGGPPKMDGSDLGTRIRHALHGLEDQLRCLCNKPDASGADRDRCPKHGEERRVFREKQEESNSRMRFEKWARSNMEFSPLERYGSGRYGGGDMPYMDHSVQCAWAAWQASTNNSNSES